MKGPEGVEIGSVVQIHPDHDLVFGGCFMVVEEVKNWGFCGYVQPMVRDRLAVAYYRVPFDACEWIGKARWK